MTYLTPDGPVEQGDVFDDCPSFGLPTDLRRPLQDGDLTVSVGRAIVLTQTCDIAQLKTDRAVVAVVYAAADLVARGAVKAAAVRDHVRAGKVYGLYFLPEAPPPIAIPESVVDFRDLHTLPLSLLEHLAASGRRVGRLATPYREHLAQHFAVTYMRIALPEPYETRP